jgi:hypothetical protein
MEPLAIQSGVSQTVRPVLSLDASLTAVLREGQTVAGEVLQSLDGKSVLIGVGRHRVPADSQTELALGDRFLARVETTAEGTILRVLGRGPESESKLLTALRGVVGSDRPVGELLEELGGSLRRALSSEGGGPEKLARLVKSLGEHVYVPGSTGEELRQLLGRSGMDHESVLAQLAAKSSSPTSAALLSELGDKLLGMLRAALGAAGVTLDKRTMGLLRTGLDAALMELAAGLEPGKGHAELSAQLLEKLRAALDGLPASRARSMALQGLPAALARLLGSESPTKLAAGLLLALSSDADLRALESSLKGQLLATLAELSDGPERVAVERALKGIEAEQLLNVARREFAEGWHLAIPIPDGERLATAHLFYRDSSESSAGEERGEGELQRISVTLELSHLGPLRADVGVREDLLALRLLVTRPEIARALEAAKLELGEQLASGGREVRVSVVLGKPEEAAVDALNQNIRWLHEHHMMDLEG